MKRLVMLLMMVLMFVVGGTVGMANAQTLAQEFKVGDKMPCYKIGAAYVDQRTISVNGVDLLKHRYLNEHSGVSYDVFWVLVSRSGFIVQAHKLPVVIVIIRDEHDRPNDIVVLYDCGLGDEECNPDGIIDRVDVF